MLNPADPASELAAAEADKADPDGRPSFRLEQLTAANGLAHEAAHDALSDVREKAEGYAEANAHAATEEAVETVVAGS